MDPQLQRLHEHRRVTLSRTAIEDNVPILNRELGQNSINCANVPLSTSDH